MLSLARYGVHPLTAAGSPTEPAARSARRRFRPSPALRCCRCCAMAGSSACAAIPDMRLSSGTLLESASGQVEERLLDAVRALDEAADQCSTARARQRGA